MKKILLLPALAVGLLLSPAQLQATPYASGVTNDAGTIRFILNEDADSVQVTLNNGSVTNDLGALPKGPHAFSLDGATNYEIRVSKASGPGFVTHNGLSSTVNTLTSPRGTIERISSDENPLLNFNLPRGMTVNRNPNSPYFGRIYVANSTAATTTLGRSVGDGIYVLNADQTDALGMGDAPLDGGLASEFAAGGGASPYRLSIGEDDNLYISDWSDANGTLFVTDPDVSAGSGANVLPGLKGALVPVGLDRVHGSINQSHVEGSLEQGNLTVYVLDEDLQDDRETSVVNQLNSIWRFDLGGSLPPEYDINDPYPLTMPERIHTPGGRAGLNNFAQTVDFERGPSGHFYITNNRQNNGGTSGLIVRNPDGSPLWNSSQTTWDMTGVATVDYCFDAYGVSVSADQKYVVSLRRDGRSILLPLTNNVPDMSGRLFLITFPNLAIARAVRFDAAGNLHAVTSGQQLLRVFSPGGTTLAITSGDVTEGSGAFRLVTAPVFRMHPASQTVDPESNVSFVAYVEGMGEVAYQWQRNGVDIEGATDVVYDLENVGPDDTGDYTLVASNELGVATSDIGTLALAAPPIPVIEPLVITELNEVTIRWSSIAERTYLVQYSVDLNTGVWHDLDYIYSTESTASAMDYPDASVEQRFYRVLLLPE